MVAFKESEPGTVEAAPAPNQQPEAEVDVAFSKRTTAPAFQFYPKEFLSSTKVIAMTATERGVYITLLSMQWLDGSLPDDLPALARLVGVNVKAFTRMWPQNLARCFVLKNGRLVNPRLEAIRVEQIAYRKRQAEHGAKGGRRVDQGLPSSGLSQTEAKTTPVPASVPAICDLHTAVRGGAPIHDTAHKNHALCGRVCLYATTFNDFVRRRNHDGADQAIRAWAAGVIDAWTSGAFSAVEPGDSLKFWSARYEEKWPASKGVRSRLETWQPKTAVRP